MSKWRIKADKPNGGSHHVRRVFNTVEQAQNEAEQRTMSAHWEAIYYVIPENYVEKRVPTYDLRGIEGTLYWL
jgi:hypothetical protein